MVFDRAAAALRNRARLRATCSPGCRCRGHPNIAAVSRNGSTAMAVERDTLHRATVDSHPPGNNHTVTFFASGRSCHAFIVDGRAHVGHAPSYSKEQNH